MLPYPFLPYALQPLKDGKVRGFVYPQLVKFLQPLLSLDHLTDHPDLRIYREHPNLVYMVRLPPGLNLPWSSIVVKRFGSRGIQHYLFSPLKRSRAMKSYRTACHLLANGLSTPLPLGAFEERRWGFLQYNVYATEAVADAVTLQQYCTDLPDGPDGLEEVIRLVACYIRRMHDSGLWHRDLVSSNILISGAQGNWYVYLVDLNRARRLPYMPLVLRAIDLARLRGLWQWLPQMCELYSVGRFSALRLLWIIRLYSHWRSWRWHIRKRLKPLRARLHI